MAHPLSRYRLRLLNDFIRIAFVPFLIFLFILSVLHVRPGFLLLPFYLPFVFSCALVRNFYSDYHRRQDAYARGAKLPPQVVGRWPGNLDVLIQRRRAAQSDYLAEFYHELFQKYESTTLNLKLLWIDMRALVAQYITMDQEHIKYITATGFDRFWKGRLIKEMVEPFLGAGIFNRDDEEWKAHRSLARPFFSRDRATDFELFERYTNTTLTIISSLSASGKAVEVQDLFSRFTLDAAAAALFGTELDSLRCALPVPGQSAGTRMKIVTTDKFGSFAQAFEACQDVYMGRITKGYFWPITQITHDDMTPHVKIIEQCIHPMAARAVERKAERKRVGMTSAEKQDVFLDHLAEHTEDPKHIQDQLLNILLAGRDTTSCLLTFITYFMALYPDVVRRMRADIMEHVGSGVPTSENIKALRYVRAVINETLRLFPPVPHNIRETRHEPVVFPKTDGTFGSPQDNDSIYMPANTPIMFIRFLTQRNQALWGSDAEQFDPDRWLDDRLARFLQNPMMYTPFNSGPRVCIGQNYALNQATYFLVRLLQRFDSFTLAPECQPEGSLPPQGWKHGRGRQAIEQIVPTAAVSTYVKGGLWVRFHSSEKDI
ncbi:unnamed protein product [Somion occarium]|uniref:Cytochrome P450 n=1 Tax=Somion occarium TaxID=3059160 RepID=A0ABP1DUF9_9APHY